MRKVGELMGELGFNKDSSVETQKAFIKHLIKAAYGIDVRDHKDVIPHRGAKGVRPNPQARRPAREPGEQLSFDFDKREESA